MNRTSTTRPPAVTGQAFNGAVLVAATLGQVPIAGVALLEAGELSLHDVRGMPHGQEELLPLCRQTLEADDLVMFARARRSAGRAVHFYAGVPLRGDDRRPAGVLFIAARDIRHLDHGARDALLALGCQVERELGAGRAAQAVEVRSRLVSMAHGASVLDEVLQLCLDEVCTHAGWPFGHACVPAGDGTGELVSAKLWHGADEGCFGRLRDVLAETRVSPGTGLSGEAAATLRPKWMDDLGLTELGAGSGFAFPVHTEDGVIAVLEFFDPDVRRPGPRVLDLVTDLGREVGLAAARMSDRAELVRSQTTLRETVHRLQTVIGTAHDAFVALDEDGCVTEWNAAAERMFGWPRAVIMGRLLADTVVPERFRADHVAGMTRLKATGESTVLGEQIELAGLHRDGREFPIELYVWQPVPTGPYRFNAFIKDISERKEAERVLRDAYAREQEMVEELRGLDRVKTDFIANVSHELRTPLTSISGYLELLVDGVAGDLTDEQREMTSIIQRNTGRLLRLVEDILTVGKIDSGQFQPSVEPTELGTLVEAVVESVEPAAIRKAITLVRQVGPDPIMVLADPNQLDRALLNVLSNAVKFTRAAGSVAIRVRRVGTEARITVADTGIGIAQDELPKLFSRFFRSTLAIEHEIQGTGLGLAIVKHIVERHGGDISVASRPGEGTMVTIVLPVDSEAESPQP
ncbi:PAS domain S-box protein [Lentzea sp. PSKA42]|uniref:histidine kinase n=1 Tax=Lentzea indica TaxID=2604800 RepID=A0ABX1FX57_9PSEU|nr:ATP-binding protein [Lentzea indica]NKE63647.1 PAS domain S-box protein [Lentzea indica]